MPDVALVELVCRNEGDLVVAEIETSGSLDAATIKRGLTPKDRARCPSGEVVIDGAQLTCAQCHGPLWFRAADGELFAANPGTLKVQP